MENVSIRRWSGFFLWVAISGGIVPQAQSSEPDGVNWSSFRGTNASGVADGHSLPTTWDVANNKNVKWKTLIPGLGHSSPVIWGSRVFVTSAISGMENPELKVGLYGNINPVEDNTSHQWIVYCLDKNTGKIIWEKTAHSGVPAIKRHTKATHANSTPATDGKHVVAFFGSEGLYCYDMNGNLKWTKNFGVLDSGYYVVKEAQWEFASSPVIADGKVFIQCDVQENSFIAAFDIETGKELWRTPRDEVPTWSTPTILHVNGKTQFIANGHKHIGGYDAETGKSLWKMRGLGDIPVPTPIMAHNLIYITTAHGEGAPVYAIRPTATGDITLGQLEKVNEHVAWSYKRRGNYMQTPLVYGDQLYLCRDSGIMACHDAKTGKVLYKKRLGRTGFTASAVAGDGKIYFTGEEGDVYVLKAGIELELLAHNEIGEVCMATPAISEGVLFFRTRDHLVAISE